MTAAPRAARVITVTQGDIRAIQLAKSALYAGARLLMDEFGVDKVDRVVLAGAFGAHISPKHAMVLGMIPDAPLDRVIAAGNAAGTGARIALLQRRSRARDRGDRAPDPQGRNRDRAALSGAFRHRQRDPACDGAVSRACAIVTLPDVSFNTRAKAAARMAGDGADGADDGLILISVAPGPFLQT